MISNSNIEYEKQCKDGIDNVLDMAEGVVDNNTNVKGE